MDFSNITIGQVIDVASNITLGGFVAMFIYFLKIGELMWRRECANELAAKDRLITLQAEQHKIQLEMAKADCTEWKAIGQRFMGYAEEALQETRAAVHAVAVLKRK